MFPTVHGVVSQGGKGSGGGGGDDIPTTGLVLHYDADSLVGVVGDGDPVTAWPDLSPSEYDLALVSGTTAPVLVEEAVNGHAAVRAAGATTMAAATAYNALVSDGAPFTLFFVYASRIAADVNEFIRLFGWRTNGAPGFGSEIAYWHAFGANIERYRTTSSNQQSLTLPRGALDEWRVITLRLRNDPDNPPNGRLLEGFVDGSLADSTSLLAANYTTGGKALAVFGEVSVTAFRAKADLAKFAVYNSALSDAARAAVEATLMARYGIS